jgi:hypothetical protein
MGPARWLGQEPTLINESGYVTPIMVAMALEEELAYFEARRQDLVQHHEGKFALIKGRELIGTYTTFAEAFEAGVARLGNVPFLIKPVTAVDSLAQVPALYTGVLSAHS